MSESKNSTYHYDYIIIGSGFGGSVSALRLSEKGYKVLVIEKGKWLKAKDFPKTNWNLKKWLWLPLLRFFGLFKLTFFRHVAVLSGVGVGGGSLVYANTLPIPKDRFFSAESWAHLADWRKELEPFYPIALKMLGANINPRLQVGDVALRNLAKEIGKEEAFQATNVAVYFGEPGKTVNDPYFNGKGPKRSGCIYCGGCMLGCRYNAKNTLDKNYLYLAQQEGAQIQAESEVYDVLPLDSKDGKNGYLVKWKRSTSLIKKKGEITAKGIIFSGGVMGTIKLLLKLKSRSLPNISNKLGQDIRTNSESLIGVTTYNKKTDFSEGIAIGSILHTDDNSHLEPVRYSAGAGAWRLLMSPLAFGKNWLVRIGRVFWDLVRHPINNIRIWFVDDWAKRTQILLFMQSLNSTLRFKRGMFGMKSKLSTGKRPTSFIPEARGLAERYSGIVDGKPTMLLTETLAGIPTTAHILGGAVMGKNATEGVIDKDNHVFGYENMLICDGSKISANPGVNPSLTITALTERAMSKIPKKIEK
jgi:cholesterol oxidase